MPERVLEARGETSIYSNVAGRIVICQERHMEDAAYVHLTPADIPIVIRWLQEVAEEIAIERSLPPGVSICGVANHGGTQKEE